jgi:hypothetical protein
MAKKAPGRPRKEEATQEEIDNTPIKKIEAPQVTEEKEAKGAIEETPIDTSKGVESPDITKEATQEKVIEVKSEPTINSQKETAKKKSVNRRMFDVKVNGKWRQVTRSGFDAISKDPNKEIVLPEGSKLVEPNIKPCKNC